MLTLIEVLFSISSAFLEGCCPSPIRRRCPFLLSFVELLRYFIKPILAGSVTRFLHHAAS